MPTTALIGLGSNLGDRRTILDSAIASMAKLGTIDGVSALRETAPVGGPPGQGSFLNAAVRLLTDHSPHQLHDQLRELERAAGRVRRVRWGERTLDLDLLIYGDQVIETSELTLPHPRFAVRRFVLGPLVEIAGEIRDPVTGLSMWELLANIDRRPSCVTLDATPGRFLDSLVDHLLKVMPREVSEGDSPWLVRTWRGLEAYEAGSSTPGVRPTFGVRVGRSAARDGKDIHSPLPWLVVRTDILEEAAAEVVTACVATRSGY